MSPPGCFTRCTSRAYRQCHRQICCRDALVAAWPSIGRCRGASTQLWHRRAHQSNLAQATAESSTDTEHHSSVLELDPISEGEYCMPGEIEIDNKSSPEFTKLSIEVKDYPGLLRVIAWVINGLDLLVENAKLTTGDDGMARNSFWITDRRGNKLSDYHADMLAERVGDFVVYCTPDRKTLSARRFESGSIAVDNEDHEQYTTVVIGERRERTAALLDVASSMTGVGCIIHEAIIQGDKAESARVSENGYDERAAASEFRFWVSDRAGNKLDYARATALLFTLNLVFGGESDALMRTPNPQHS